MQSLRIYDYTDYDNTGTRIVSSQPVAVAYGQDTEQAIGGDPIIDTGYTIFPIIQRFLDPVLTLEKTASPTSVPTTGGPVDFTLTCSPTRSGRSRTFPWSTCCRPGSRAARRT